VGRINNSDAGGKPAQIRGTDKIGNKRVYRQWAEGLWTEQDDPRMSARRVFPKIGKFYVKGEQALGDVGSNTTFSLLLFIISPYHSEEGFAPPVSFHQSGISC
jgi:hypothetical protein